MTAQAVTQVLCVLGPLLLRCSTNSQQELNNVTFFTNHGRIFRQRLQLFATVVWQTHANRKERINETQRATCSRRCLGTGVIRLPGPYAWNRKDFGRFDPPRAPAFYWTVQTQVRSHQPFWTKYAPDPMR